MVAYTPNILSFKRLLKLAIVIIILISLIPENYTLRINTNLNKSTKQSPFVSKLQQNDSGGEEVAGSMFDTQEIVIDPTLTQTPSAQTESPEQMYEETAAATQNDLDDRLMHMMNIEVAGVEEEGTTSVTSGADANTEYVIETRYVAQGLNDYDYRIHDFDSDVKRDVYPDPQTEGMIAWGIFLIA